MIILRKGEDLGNQGGKRRMNTRKTLNKVPVSNMKKIGNSLKLCPRCKNRQLSGVGFCLECGKYYTESEKTYNTMDEIVNDLKLGKLKPEEVIILDEAQLFLPKNNHNPLTNTELDSVNSKLQDFEAQESKDYCGRIDEGKTQPQPQNHTFSPVKEETPEERQKLKPHSRNQRQDVKSGNAVEGTKIQAVGNKQNPSQETESHCASSESRPGFSFQETKLPNLPSVELNFSPDNSSAKMEKAKPLAKDYLDKSKKYPQEEKSPNSESSKDIKDSIAMRAKDMPADILSKKKQELDEAKKGCGCETAFLSGEYSSIKTGSVPMYWRCGKNPHPWARYCFDCVIKIDLLEAELKGITETEDVLRQEILQVIDNCFDNIEKGFEIMAISPEQAEPFVCKAWLQHKIKQKIAEVFKK